MTDHEQPDAGVAQAFEAYPTLAWHIERMACEGNTGSVVQWGDFLQCLNSALRAPTDAGGAVSEAADVVRRWANWIIDESSDMESDDHDAGKRKVRAERDLILAALTPAPQAEGEGMPYTDWKVGDLAERIEDHALVRAGERHAVTKMYRGGYLGFAGRVGGEWSPNGWRLVTEQKPFAETPEKGSVAHQIEMAVVRTTLRNAVIPPATSCGQNCDCTAECERDFCEAPQPLQQGGEITRADLGDLAGLVERLWDRLDDGDAFAAAAALASLAADRDKAVGLLRDAMTELSRSTRPSHAWQMKVSAFLSSQTEES